MKLVKTLNNNVAIACDADGREFVVIGLGIGYIPKGADIPEERIERVFASLEESGQLLRLADAVPQRFFELATEIVDYAQSTLNTELSSSIYLSLADHLSYVHERVGKGLLPQNSLTWEIRRYYPDEFQVGKKAVELLEDEFSCELSDDEAASIALHIVNAELGDASFRQGMDSVKLMDQILQIIRYQTHLACGEDDLDYQRLVVHVKFFVQRIYGGRPSGEPSALYKMVRESYPEAFSVAQTVRTFVEGRIGRSILDEEITYLIIHIARLLRSREG